MKLVLVLFLVLSTFMSFAKVDNAQELVKNEIAKEIKNIDVVFTKEIVHENGNKLLTVQYLIPEDLTMVTKAAIANKLEAIGYDFLVCSNGQVLPLINSEKRINECK